MTTDANQNLWRFIHLDQYNPPPEKSRETTLKRIFGLWRRLGWGNKTEESTFDEQELSQVPQELLDKVAPVPDWTMSLEAMTEVLKSWLDAKVPGSEARVFVGPPYHGIPEILTGWAQARGWRLLSAPAPEIILSGGEEWLAQIDEGEDPLVLPHLEHCFLRHYDGLTLLRRLLENILSHSRRWLLGCDSWAWAYLSKALNMDGVFPQPFILAAFDAERLQLWFQQLAAQGGEGEFVFREAESGKYVLPPPMGMEDSRDTNAGPGQVSNDFLKHIATYSRGITGIAWAVWRRSLGFVVSAEEHAEEKNQKTERVEADDRAYLIRVKPWSQLHLPEFPNQRPSLPLLMIVHTLLIHGGLWSRVLSELLPLSPMEIMEHLYYLEVAGLLESDQEFWRVSPLGYLPLSQALLREGYLADAIT